MRPGGQEKKDENQPCRVYLIFFFLCKGQKHLLVRDEVRASVRCSQIPRGRFWLK